MFTKHPSSQDNTVPAVSSTARLSSRRLIAIALCGCLALLAAFVYRHRIQALRKPDVAASLAAQAKPLLDELTALKAAVQRNPKDLAAHEALATFYQQNGFTAQAMLQCQLAINIKPDAQEPRLHLARLLLITQQGPAGEKMYKDLTKRWPDSAEAWQGLSTVYFHKHDYLDAMTAGQRAYQLNPKDDGNKLALAAASLHYALQFSYADLYANQYNTARSLLLELTKTLPNDPQVHFMLGNTLRMMRHYPEAIVSLRRSLDLDPNDPRAVAELGRSYTLSGDRATARKVVEDAIARGIKDADVYGLDAQIITQLGEPDCDVKSVAMLEKAIELDPLDIDYLQRLGSAYTRVNRLDDARKIFERILKTNPDVAFPYQQLSTIYARMGHRERSTLAATMATRMSANENQLRQLQLLAKTHPENDNIHLALGERYMYLKMRGPAKEQFLLTLQNNPKNARALKGLAALEKAAPAPRSKTASIGTNGASSETAAPASGPQPASAPAAIPGTPETNNSVPDGTQAADASATGKPSALQK